MKQLGVYRSYVCFWQSYDKFSLVNKVSNISFVLNKPLMFWWTSWTPFNFDISVKFSWIQIEFLKPKSLSPSKHNPYTSPVFCVRKLNHKYQDAYHVNTKRICSNHHLKRIKSIKLKLLKMQEHHKLKMLKMQEHHKLKACVHYFFFCLFVFTKL